MTQADVTLAQDSKTTASAVLDGAKEEITPSDVPAKPGEEKLSPKLQMLLKRERAAIERERAAKAKEAEIEAKAKAFADREARLEEFEKVKATNPRRALELLGLSYEDLTKVELADGQVPAEVQVKRVEEKLNSLVKTQEEALRRQEEEAKRAAEKQQQEAVESFRKEIGTYLKENSSRYELMDFHYGEEEARDIVYAVVDEHYERTRPRDPVSGEPLPDSVGEVLTIAQAADKVEAWLEQKYQKAPTLNKMKAFLAPPKPEIKLDKPQTPQRQTPKTLNNNLSATPAPQRTRPLTDEERVARAIAYAQGLRP